MPLIFNTEAFAKVPENLVDSNKPNIKKYNVRVHKTDLVILDALAARSGISRSQLLNQLVEKILLNTLCTLDTRAAYYVANVANKLAGISPKERSEEHTSELQSRENLVCRLLLEKKNTNTQHKQ